MALHDFSAEIILREWMDKAKADYTVRICFFMLENIHSQNLPAFTVNSVRKNISRSGLEAYVLARFFSKLLSLPVVHTTYPIASAGSSRSHPTY